MGYTSFRHSLQLVDNSPKLICKGTDFFCVVGGFFQFFFEVWGFCFRSQLSFLGVFALESLERLLETLEGKWRIC